MRPSAGQAAVELVLVLPFLLLLVLGTIQLGLVLNAQLGVTQAAREGAQLASTGGPYGQVVQLARTDAPLVQSLQVAESYAPDGSSVTVTVTGQVPVLVPDLPFLGSSVPVSASTTMLMDTPPTSGSGGA
jgi:Flp pilus assembly protein TadG